MPSNLEAFYAVGGYCWFGGILTGLAAGGADIFWLPAIMLSVVGLAGIITEGRARDNGEAD